MRRATLAVVVPFALTLPLFAQPKITSITPASGPVTGGTTITVKGSGFSALCIVCSPRVPPVVTVGGAVAEVVISVDESTLTAVTPPHLPALSDVSVRQFDGTGTLPNAFRFEGKASDAFDRILLPVYIEPVLGAFGSEFRTALESRNIGTQELSVFGLGHNCGGIVVLCPGVFPLDDPGVLLPGSSADPARYKDGTPGRLLYVPKGRSSDLALNLRAYDVSRNALSFGTEIPIVRDRDFQSDRLVLLGVPTNRNFRETLRIYADSPATVAVSIKVGDREPVLMELPQGTDLFDPAFGVFTSFTPTDLTVTERVEMTVILPPTSLPVPTPPPRIWAFVTVTNNTTQEITTITPH